MFKDYYKILGVSTDASVEIIRKAYRNLSLKWHPDRNPDTDVTSIMQDINEAYAILKDEEKRSLYDEEYRSFMKDFGVCIKDECNRSYEPDYDYNDDYNTYEEERDWDFDYTYDYDVKDEKLKDEILKARQYAKDIVDDFIKNFGVLTKTASKGAADSILKYALAWIVAGILLFILGNIFTCS